MNRKLARLLQPSFQLYFVCLVLFALISAFFSIPLAVVELAVVLALSVYSRQHSNRCRREIARYLEANPYVKAVYYPGLESHPQHELASRQMENGMYGGMISFELKDDVKGLSSFAAGKKLLNSLKIPAIAVSLGDPDSLIEHPASMTHANVSPEDRLAAGITDGLIRLSVGLESAKDLIADFEQAFAAI